MKRGFCCFCFFLITILSLAAEKTESTSYKPLDIEGSEKEEVIPFRNKMLSRHEVKWLANVLSVAEPYRLYVRKRLQEEKMPRCLEYLPVIESSYKPTAKPVNGESVGIWQFMPNSVYPYLTLNEWVDERRDPWKSTDAALSKLKDNYKQFGSWDLALAAYNCGAGAVRRALEKTDDKTYWSLCRQKLIPEHAIRYVPNFLSVADVVTNADFYDLNEISSINNDALNANPFFLDFDYVTVNKSISLLRLASELRIESETLLSLNLALVKGKTPPDTEYKIRLPQGMKQSAEDAIYSIFSEENFR